MTKRSCCNYKQNIVWLGTRYPTSTPPNFHNVGSFPLTERSSFIIFFSNKQTPPHLYWICPKVFCLLLWLWQMFFFCFKFDCDRILFHQLLTQRTWTWNGTSKLRVFMQQVHSNVTSSSWSTWYPGLMAVCCVVGLRGDYFKVWPNKDKAILRLCLWYR